MAAQRSITAELTQELDERLAQLADVRDLLAQASRGEGAGENPGVAAMFARTALVEAATELERIAFEHGLLPHRKPGQEGWFLSEFPRHG